MSDQRAHGNDDLETVVKTLRERHNSAKVTTYENNGYDEHIGYYDKGEKKIACGALRYVQEQGFEIIQAGTNYLHERDETKGWMEVVR